MTLAEFLRWDDGTDTRYELIDGTPVAMAPPVPAHGLLVSRLNTRIEPALASRPPCMVVSGVGVARADRDDTCYIPDLAVTCTPLSAADQLLSAPVLIGEVLSPSTANFDRQIKVPGYRRIPSVEEIMLIDSRSIFAEVQRRTGDQWLHEIVQGPDAVLAMVSVGLSTRLGELYSGLDLAAAG